MMNERIRELAEQAGFENGHQDRYGNSLSQELEKFAELIILECAQICFSESKGHDMAFGEHCGIVIKEHFGVEE
jgi:hypothetical protein